MATIEVRRVHAAAGAGIAILARSSDRAQPDYYCQVYDALNLLRSSPGPGTGRSSS
ncbi:hypothetical protein ACGFIW_06460 [Micromonospora sp. NPDC048935]|uniref:hypothetical protein n=1 Tax=Micromonospora sp. NPDC048935 TaxID=3364262 RepID=UPI0037160466